MKPRTTIILLVVAAIVGIVVWADWGTEVDDTKWERVFPGFKTIDATKIELTRGGEPPILIVKDESDAAIERWKLEKPTAYPADLEPVKALLNNMEYAVPRRELEGDDLKGFDFGETAVTAKIWTTAREEPWDFTFGTTTDNDTKRYLRHADAPDSVMVVDKELFEKFDKRSPELLSKAIFNILDDKARRVSVKPVPGAPDQTLVLEHRDGFWRLGGAPGAGYANKAEVDALLARARGTKAAGFVEDSKALAEYGLDAPAHTVTVASESVEQTLLLGKEDPDNEGQRFGRIDGYDVVFRVHPGKLLDGLEPSRFESRQLLALNATPVSDLTVKIAGGDAIAIVRSGTETEWKLTSPVAQPADTGAVNDLLANLRNLQRAEVVTGPIDLAQYGLAEPALSVTVEQVGLERTLHFGNVGADGLTFVKRGEEDVVLKADASRIPPLAKTGWIHFRKKQIFAWSRFDAHEISVATRGGETFELVKKENKWRLAKNDKIVEDAKVNELLERLEPLAATSFAPDVDPAKAGLQPPFVTVKVKTKRFLWDAPKTPDGETPEEVAEHVLHLGGAVEGGAGYYARVPDLESPFVVPNAVVDVCRADFARRDQVFIMNRWDASKIRIAPRDGAPVVIAKDDFKWSVVEGDEKAKKLGDEAGQDLLSAMAELQAKVRRPGVGAAEAGLEPPAAVVTVTTEKSVPDSDQPEVAEFVLEIGGPTEQGARFARSKDIEQTFVLPADVLEKVQRYVPDALAVPGEPEKAPEEAPEPPADEGAGGAHEEKPADGDGDDQQGGDKPEEDG